MQTEEQKVQELLKPRYKVVADYPGSEFTINQIIVPQLQNERHEFGSGLILMLSAFPHLFRKLEWWQERDEREMPEYVRNAADGIVFKVEYNFKGHTPSDVHTWNDQFKTPFWHSLYDLLPATSAEYTAYIEKQPTTQNQGV